MVIILRRVGGQQTLYGGFVNLTMMIIGVMQFYHHVSVGFVVADASGVVALVDVGADECTQIDVVVAIFDVNLFRVEWRACQQQKRLQARTSFFIGDLGEFSDAGALDDKFCSDQVQIGGRITD